MALIQTTVDDDVKARADAAFSRCGITTPMAVRMLVTQVANEGRTPFDGLFTGVRGIELAEAVRRDMVYVEAQEFGLIPDDAGDAAILSDAVLEALGVAPDEVGQ